MSGPVAPSMRPLPDPPSPIGVFDSGLGGLSVWRALRRRLPGERYICVADSGHAPYGDRDARFVEARAIEITRFLLQHHAKALVLACNTASVVAAQTLRTRFALPIVAMEPAIKPAAALTRSKVVLVLATSTTIASPAVARLCRLHGAGLRMILQPCPGLVEQIEAGAFDDSATHVLLETCLRPGLDAGADTIVLGCTHYPLLREQIAHIAGPGVTLIEPSDAVARQLERVLPAAPTADPAGSGAATLFYTSGSLATLRGFLQSIGEPDAEVRALPAPGQAGSVP